MLVRIISLGIISLEHYAPLAIGAHRLSSFSISENFFIKPHGTRRKPLAVSWFCLCRQAGQIAR